MPETPEVQCRFGVIYIYNQANIMLVISFMLMQVEIHTFCVWADAIDNAPFWINYLIISDAHWFSLLTNLPTEDFDLPLKKKEWHSSFVQTVYCDTWNELCSAIMFLLHLNAFLKSNVYLFVYVCFLYLLLLLFFSLYSDSRHLYLVQTSNIHI